jgi:uracil-DNA glycosylase
VELQITVPAIYPEGCKIVFIGEAPGEEEESMGEGWVGAAGKVLQRAAQVAGIPWATVGRSNVAKRRPPGNRFKECFYETVEEPIYTKTGKLSKKTKKIVRPTREYHYWVDALRLELRARSPNLVVACGNEALEAITGLSGVTNYRGSILPDAWGDSHKVLAAEHPSYIIRGGGGKQLDLAGEASGQGKLFRFWILAHDLKKAKREMEFGEIRREPYISSPDPQHTLWFVIRELGVLRDCNETKWTLDVETRAGTLACFSIGYKLETEGAWRTFCIPIQTTSGPYWTPTEELEIWRALRETVQANPNLCNQNIEYDIYYLLRYGVEPSGVYMDTMLAHSILYPEFPKSLGFLCSFYLDDVSYYKTEEDDRGDTKVRNDQELWEYCCKDAVHTRRIVDKIDEELRRRGLFEFYHGAGHEVAHPSL